MLHVVNNNSGVFNIYVFVNAGGIYEPDGKLGISHMLEHMLFKRSKNMTNEQLLKHLTRIGGSFNAATDKDVTFYYIKTNTENANDCIELMKEILITPSFTEKNLDSERKVVIEELNKGLDNDERLFWQMSYMSILDKNNAYMNKVIGTVNTLKAIKAKDLYAYYDSYYNSYSIIVDCEKNIEKEVRIHLHDAFKTKIAPVPRTRPYFNEELDRKVIVMNINLNQYTLSLSFPMVIDTFSVKEYIILEFISFMLSGAGLYSLLMYELRQKRSLVYNVGAYNDCMKYLSLFKINIATTQHDTVQIIDVVLNTINNLKTGSVVSKKLKFFKKSFESAMKLNLSNADYKCFLLGTIMFNSDNKIMINETDLMKVVKSITISDIAKNCKKIFHIDKMGIVAVGKYENPQIQANNILDSLKKWQNK